jgi:hypothetical protein
MPSFDEIVGTLVAFIVVATATGHRDWVSRGLVEIRHSALVGAKADWGCPSLTFGACSSYDSRRYRQAPHTHFESRGKKIVLTSREIPKTTMPIEKRSYHGPSKGI